MNKSKNGFVKLEIKESSNIMEMHYNKEKEILYVRNKKDLLYRYENVNEVEVEILLNQESIGKAVHELLIKTNKPCVKVNDII